MSRRSLLFATLLMLPLTGSLRGQDSASPGSRSTLVPQRQEVLEWLAGYVDDEIVLTPEVLTALMEKVGQLSDEEFSQWYRETHRLRAILQSPQWLETRQWLQEFLAVQAIYSDEQLEAFRLDVARMTPAEMVEVIERIRRKHQSFVWMREASHRNRRASLSLREDLMQQQRSTVPTAVASAQFGPSTRTPTPRKSTYAERQNSYRRNFYIWPGGGGWWRW